MNKIGIIGAMELEVAALKEQMNCTRRLTRAGMDFWEGTLNGAEVVIVQSGIGKVLAGICVQILADQFHVTHIINTGVAGSLNAALDIGDIVVSQDAVYHDFDVTKLGYQPGQVPGRDTVSFPADPALIAAAAESCKRVNPDIHCIVGRIASGDQFISDQETKNRIISMFAGFCAEMEGCAIAQAATVNKIPFVIIRAISDKADDSAQMDYPAFEKAAAHHSALLVADLVRKFEN
ncbi:MAG: 5'-methylthioadenosine/adenosylhomocysteine nucleosidase [Lachnospiraceae bacterium]|nr:5'-methylthioadenosine/adenosylhomocysteine nucleosidase [Lachnospiraceae bacterium]